MIEVLIECHLSRIVRREDPHESQYIYLVEKGGTRSFPIVIGKSEADEIHRKIWNIRTPRPLTHDLLRNTLSSIGVRITSVEVDELRDGTFHAKLVLQNNGQETRIDCRPSDGIALAVAAEVPISVDEKVIADASGSA